MSGARILLFVVFSAVGAVGLLGKELGVPRGIQYAAFLLVLGTLAVAGVAWLLGWRS